MLSFQRLDVYQRSIEFLSLVYEIVARLPRGNADRADQLTRSAESVVRNIAEGAGRWSPADCANRYRIARGEAMECAASLDVLKLRKLLTDEDYCRGILLLEGVVAMLTRWFERIDDVHVAVAVKVHDSDDVDGYLVPNRRSPASPRPGTM